MNKHDAPEGSLSVGASLPESSKSQEALNGFSNFFNFSDFSDKKKFPENHNTWEFSIVDVLYLPVTKDLIEKGYERIRYRIFPGGIFIRKGAEQRGKSCHCSGH